MSKGAGVTMHEESLSDEASKAINNSSSQSQLMMEEFHSNNDNSTSVWEIEEECFEISMVDDHVIENSINNTYGVSSLTSIKEKLDETVSVDYDDDGVVYVGVGKGNSSMDALVWLLNDIKINSSGTGIFLIHVYPEIRFIPTPLGKLPISQVNPQQKETYENQERIKRRDMLQKFIDVCSASKVKVDTILIESDMEAKALLDLIPILNIRKLILGTAKSSLRKLRSRKGNGIVDQVLQNAPQFCEVNIICEGAVVDTMYESPSSSSSPSPHEVFSDRTKTLKEEQNTNSFVCTCFKSKTIG